MRKDNIKSCEKCGAGPLGNCGYYGCETPRNTCPLTPALEPSLAVSISRDLLGKIVDEVFDGAIEDASVIGEIYAAIKKHEAPAPQDPSGSSDAERDLMRTALERIAGPRDCGCTPSCQCNSQESLEIEVDALRDIAIAALSKATS